MDHKINIKFGEVNNLSDARYAAGIGASFLGFNLSQSHPCYIAEDKMKEICGWVSGPKPVAEWENESIDTILEVCTRMELDYVQLNAFNPSITASLKADFCVIQNILIAPDMHVSDLIATVDKVNGLAMYYMLSFDDLAGQELFLSKPSNSLLLKDFCRDQPVFLNFHFTPDNLTGIIRDFQPFGINLKGGLETNPAHKDFDALNELISVLEENS